MGSDNSSILFSDNFGQPEADDRYLRSTQGITTQNLADGSVTGSKLATDALNNTVENSDLTAECVRSGNIREGTVEPDRLNYDNTLTPLQLIAKNTGEHFVEVPYVPRWSFLSPQGATGKNILTFNFSHTPSIIYLNFKALRHGNNGEANEGFNVLLNDITTGYNSVGEFGPRKRTSTAGFYICSDSYNDRHNGSMTLVRAAANEWYETYTARSTTNNNFGIGSGNVYVNAAVTKLKIKTLSGNFSSGSVGVTYA